MVKNIWMSHIGRCTALGYLNVGHISSNYHQHSKCTVLFVKHHYFHLSSFKKLLSSCWLIQVYIQCKTISSCRIRKNRNWNSVRHCIKLDRKCRNLLYATRPYSAMFPRHIHHISIPNNAMKCSRMSEKWAKKYMFRVHQNAQLNSLKIHKNCCTLRNGTSCR